MQTSIEWFIEHLLSNGLLRLTKEDHSLYSELRDKAKEMHKKEIETLYTEEQVRQAFEAGMEFIGEDKGSFNEFIQSLKQPKKD